MGIRDMLRHPFIAKYAKCTKVSEQSLAEFRKILSSWWYILFYITIIDCNHLSNPKHCRSLILGIIERGNLVALARFSKVFSFILGLLWVIIFSILVWTILELELSLLGISLVFITNHHFRMHQWYLSSIRTYWYERSLCILIGFYIYF